MPLTRQTWISGSALAASGFELMTAPGSTSPTVAFAIKDTQLLAKKLAAAHIDIAV